MKEYVLTPLIVIIAMVFVIALVVECEAEFLVEGVDGTVRDYGHATNYIEMSNSVELFCITNSARMERTINFYSNTVVAYSNAFVEEVHIRRHYQKKQRTWWDAVALPVGVIVGLIIGFSL